MPRRTPPGGFFISFEGIDGCGKSTQARVLADTLRGEGREVTLTREPGGSPGAEEIRQLLVAGRGDRWSPHTDLLLFNAARRDHLERTIVPALQAGHVVISDRFVDSTRVYQGLSGNLPAEVVDGLHELMIGIEPDRTFVIDLDPALSLGRTGLRAAAAAAGLAAQAAIAGDAPLAVAAAAAAQTHAADENRFEGLGLSFQQRLRQGFHDLAARYPDRIRLIDGAGEPATVAARVRAAL
ncbi:dTMP kinase [Paracoccus suum]|uniref:Thymidylate kinase n=1 Tax=Paracoccus suum TaxID=2259340 RepID=A0A344PNK1_9RHOB|nr:dTMP kinase [Paracoccus suum]